MFHQRQYYCHYLRLKANILDFCFLSKYYVYIVSIQDKNNNKLNIRSGWLKNNFFFLKKHARAKSYVTSVNSEAFGLVSKTWAITWLGLSVLEAVKPA